jgi:hypothetical protein
MKLLEPLVFPESLVAVEEVLVEDRKIVVEMEEPQAGEEEVVDSDIQQIKQEMVEMVVEVK